jgi:hypothetical protein
MEFSSRVNVKVLLGILTLLLASSVIIYVLLFRYSKVYTVTDENGNQLSWYQDKLLTEDVNVSECYCIGESYNVIRLNGKDIYKFYLAFQTDPIVGFYPMSIEGDSLILESKKFKLKIPYKLKNVNKSKIVFENIKASITDFEYYKSDSFIRDYKLKYLFFPYFPNENS